MAQQTAVEWLVSELNQKIDFIPIDKWDMIRDIVQAAKQMEREQRINAQMDMFNHINGLDYGTDYLNRRDAALKYAEDYTTRLQNETNLK
jgi:hypothetical protein